MRFSVDPVTGAKACTLTVRPVLYDGIPWGPVVSYLWSGDIGYWIETVQVRQAGLTWEGRARLPVRTHF